jgi:hypothetical protein
MRFSIKRLVAGALIGLLIFPLIISACFYLSALFGVNPITGGQDIYEIVKVGYQITQDDADAFKNLEGEINSLIELCFNLSISLGFIGFISHYISNAIGSALKAIEDKISDKKFT